MRLAAVSQRHPPHKELFAKGAYDDVYNATYLTAVDRSGDTLVAYVAVLGATSLVGECDLPFDVGVAGPPAADPSGVCRQAKLVAVYVE